MVLFLRDSFYFLQFLQIIPDLQPLMHASVRKKKKNEKTDALKWLVIKCLYHFEKFGEIVPGKIFISHCFLKDV